MLSRCADHLPGHIRDFTISRRRRKGFVDSRRVPGGITPYALIMVMSRWRLGADPLAIRAAQTDVCAGRASPTPRR